MAIDFDKVARRGDREIVYLLRVEYHDAAGVKQFVRWCGPPLKCGSGIVFRDPDDNEGKPLFWEPRCSNLSVEHDAGPLKQRVQTISDLSLRVRATADDALRTELLKGRWANKKALVWAVEVDLTVGRPVPTGNTRALYSGKTDKGPTSIEEDTFALRFTASIMDPGQPWPVTRLPEDDVVAGGIWSDIDTSGPTTKPAAVRLSPQNFGKFVPPVFGDGAGQVWKELLVFGSRTSGSGPVWWAHVSPQINCYVHDVYMTDANDEVTNLVSNWGGTITTMENTATTEGPTGTNVRLLVPTAYQTLFDPDLHRIIARVSGPEVGQIATSPDYNSSGTVREDVDEILEDVFTDPWLMNVADPFGTGALAAFDSTKPLVDADAWRVRASVPLLDDEDGGGETPLAMDVLGDLMRRLNADLVMRYDSTTDEIRIAPIWRAPQSGAAADHTFYPHDLASTAPLPLVVDRDPDGTYANRVRVKEGDKFESPDGTNEIFEVIAARVTQDEDATEQGATKYGLVREVEESVEHWTHHDTSAAEEAAADLLFERAQEQIVIEAELGLRAFAVEMGDAVEYVVDGVPTDPGMVRSIEIDWDALAIRLVSYHLTFYGGGGD